MGLKIHNFPIQYMGYSNFEKIRKYINETLNGKNKRIMMYDDYFTENFVDGGYLYYPLTILGKKNHQIHWIKWRIKEFEPPYEWEDDAVVEDGNETVPQRFIDVMSTRPYYYDYSKYLKFRHEPPHLIISRGYGKSAKYFYSKETHYEQRLIDDIAMQVSDWLKSHVKREGWIKEEYNGSIGFTDIKLNSVDNLWYWSVGIHDRNAFGKHLWLRSEEKPVPGMTSLKIEICDKVSKEVDPKEGYDAEVPTPPPGKTLYFMRVVPYNTADHYKPPEPYSSNDVVHFIETRGEDEAAHWIDIISGILNGAPEIVEKDPKLKKWRDKMNEVRERRKNRS